MPKRPSLEEIMAKRGVEDGVLYRAAKMPKSYNKESRSATFIMTDETPDSYGDIVRAKGAKMDRFVSNPIALLNHNKSQILGTWDNVRRIAKRIEGEVTLASEGTADYIDMTAKLMEQGILRAASIGFMPDETEFIEDKDGDWTGGLDFKSWDLTECSVVAVPANPTALAKSIQQGNHIAREFLEEILDTYTKTAHGLIVPKADLEEAYKEGTGKGETVTVNISEPKGFQEDPDEEVLFKMETELEEEIENDPGFEKEGWDENTISIKVDLDTADAEKQISSLQSRLGKLLQSAKEAMGLAEKEPQYVEGGLEEAKALRERLHKELVG